MRRKDFRLVFMGTPDFAVPSLRKLFGEGYDLRAVVTAPDKPAGRGLNLRKSPVKIFAEENQIPVLQPDKLRDPVFVKEIEETNPHLIVVVAFRMLPDIIWRMPEHGTINLHASLLPQYRGAAPINWAIINGETQSGLSTFFIDDKIDTGRVIDQIRVPITHETNAGDLHDRMMEKGATVLLKTVDKIRQGNYESKIQHAILDNNTELKAAPKISREDCRISWSSSPEHVHNLVRGLSPYPGAFTHIKLGRGEEFILKIFQGKNPGLKTELPPGTIKMEARRMLISCNGGFYEPEIVQLAGKQKMHIDVFLNGFTVGEDASVI